MTKPFNIQDKPNIEETVLAGKRYHYFNAVWSIIFCFITASLAFISNLIYQFWYVFLAIQIVGFISAGIFYSKIEIKRKPLDQVKNYNSSLFKAAFISIIICVGVSLIYWFAASIFTWLGVVAAAAFFLPLFYSYSKHAFISIPQKHYPIWYKRNNLIENKAFVFLTSVPIKIKLSIQAFDHSNTTFNSTVPAQMEFGKIFHYFLIQQQMNEIFIEVENEYGEPHGWQFYIEELKGLQLKQLNPDFNLWENQVKSNNTIVAKRVIQKPGKFISKYSIKSYEQR